MQAHGMSETITYRKWAAMKTVCYNKKSPSYRCYGGRGITVCKRWDSFKNFYTDMGACPQGMWLCRINKNGNYKPSNCKWGTPGECNGNTSKSVHLTYNGETMSKADWARKLGISRSAFGERINENLPNNRIFIKGLLKEKICKTSKYKRLYGMTLREISAATGIAFTHIKNILDQKYHTRKEHRTREYILRTINSHNKTLES